MAIFYDYIKGIDNTGSITTYIKFNKQIIDNEDNFNFPTINLNNNGDDSYGQIITTGTASHHDAQTIVSQKHLCFGNNITYITSESANELEIKGDTRIILNSSNINFTGKNIYFDTATDSSSNLLYNSGLFTLSKSLSILGTLTTKNKLTVSNNTQQSGADIYGPVQVYNGNITRGNSIINEGYISATYFLATSDKRAKENFELAPSMLDIINSIPVYTFNYKSSPEDRNLGIIAQDIEKYKFLTKDEKSEFSFILNLPTKGLNDGFKAIKETKLIYVLWKGIQEESGKISRLEEENAALAKKVDKLEKVVEQLIKLTGLEVINETIEE